MNIRKATEADATAIAAIMVPIIREGATYTLDPEMSEAEALAYWMGHDKETFVAERDGVVLGTYYMRSNQAGGGRHVCNCGYMTNAAARGRGIARRMCEHSLEYARSRGYRAMQFNFVVSTNERAVRLWQSLGFDIVGRLPAVPTSNARLCGLICYVPAPLSNVRFWHKADIPRVSSDVRF